MHVVLDLERIVHHGVIEAYLHVILIFAKHVHHLGLFGTEEL